MEETAELKKTRAQCVTKVACQAEEDDVVCAGGIHLLRSQNNQDFGPSSPCSDPTQLPSLSFRTTTTAFQPLDQPPPPLFERINR